MPEFVCLPWSEVCSARVTSLLLLLLLGGSLIRAPDNEESALLLMYADDLVLLTTSELHLESALDPSHHCHQMGYETKLFLHDSRETPETAVSLLHQKRLGSGSVGAAGQ